VSNEHEVARADLGFEFMLGALRLREGFDWAWFTERTGLPASSVRARLDAAAARGLIEFDAGGAIVRPTARGFDFLSDLQSMFLPPASSPRGG
jgi:oxygen-independent coproporphyrinogen-3 oxidase